MLQPACVLHSDLTSSNILVDIRDGEDKGRTESNSQGCVQVDGDVAGGDEVAR